MKAAYIANWQDVDKGVASATNCYLAFPDCIEGREFIALRKWCGIIERDGYLYVPYPRKSKFATSADDMIRNFNTKYGAWLGQSEDRWELTDEAKKEETWRDRPSLF